MLLYKFKFPKAFSFYPPNWLSSARFLVFCQVPSARLTGESFLRKSRQPVKTANRNIGRVVALKVETDGDIRIALADSSGDKPGIIVAEVPAKHEVKANALYVTGLRSIPERWCL
jgi:hypothetical protein